MARIRIVAPSSVVPQAELALGVRSLQESGFDVEVDPQCRRKHLFFAGTHQERARALLDAAYSFEGEIIWCARGGYGANHLLAQLEAETARRGKPRGRKLLVGSSDATSLLQFAAERWGFSVLHAPMPGLRNFVLLSDEERSSLLDWVRGRIPNQPWGRKFKRLKWWGKAPARAIEGSLAGGNLTVWNTLLGTRHQPRVRRGSGERILFLEDVTEFLPRLDRAVRHLVDAGGLEGVSAIVLGNFLKCDDAVPQVLARVPADATIEQLREPPEAWMAPLRKKLGATEGLREIFEAVSKETQIPVAFGLPVGHGPDHFSLPMGATARIEKDGSFKILNWCRWRDSI